MQTQVDFYILSEMDADKAEQFACQLTNLLYQRQKQTYLLCNSDEQATRIDEKLWTLEPTSFIPHARDHQKPDIPILVGTDPGAACSRDTLMNLSTFTPIHPEKLSRIIEIVTDDERAKEHARERFRKYRELGFELMTHK